MIRARLATCAALVAALVGGVAVGAERELRVCADPNNLPFSNEQEEGFENRIAELVADELGAELSYTWWAQRRGFIRNTLRAGACDLVIGVPAGYELVETTDAYYRSAYVYVYRADRGLDLRSIRDPRLRNLRIGVHLIGDDGVNPPPAHALGQLGIVDNVVGYMIYGDYREANPPARIVEAVARGDLDVAAVWGPIGGYFAKHASVPLEAVPITDTAGFAPLRFEFGIAMGVRKGEHAFRDELNGILAAAATKSTGCSRRTGCRGWRKRRPERGTPPGGAAGGAGDGMMRVQGLPLFPWMLALAAVLSACGQDEGPAEQATVEPEPVQVWSFQRTTGEVGESIVDRLPASPTRTVLVPATNLFPGGARIDPEIENPYAGDAAAIAAGERHFAAFNCAGCHAPLGGGGMGPPLSDDEWIYGAEPAQIYLTILHGRPEGMPAFGSMLPRQTIWELVAYIETLDEIENPAAELGFDPAPGQDDSPSEDENAQADQ